MTNKILRALVKARKKHRGKKITTVRPTSSSLIAGMDFAGLYPSTMRTVFGPSRNILRRIKIRKILNG